MYIISSILIFIVFVSFLLTLDQTLVSAQFPTPSIIKIVPDASKPTTPNPFDPPSISKPLGMFGSITIKWINTDTVIHTVTSFTNSFESPILGPNQPFNHTFYYAGYYNYYCRLHPYMTGVVIIT